MGWRISALIDAVTVEVLRPTTCNFSKCGSLTAVPMSSIVYTALQTLVEVPLITVQNFSRTILRPRLERKIDIRHVERSS